MRASIIRSFDDRGRMVGGVLAADGPHAARLIGELLRQPDIALVQVRDAVPDVSREIWISRIWARVLPVGPAREPA